MVEQVNSLRSSVKYKDTPTGRIPVDWEVVRLGDICRIRRGASPRPINDPSFFSRTGRGWIRISDVTSTYKHLKKTSQYLSEKGVSRSVKVNSGDLIMSICATVGKPIIVGIEACIHDGFVLFSDLSEKVHTEFLFYFLQKNEEHLAAKGQIGTQGNLNTNIVRRTILPLPPLPEQEKIAEILTTVDDAIEKTTQVIENANELKKGLMQRLLTRGIGHKKFKKTEIGEIPVEWKVVKLGQVANLKNGVNFKKEQKGERGILTIDVLNMYSTSIYIDSTTLYRIDLDLMNKEDYILKEGDILFVRSSVKREGVGWACLFKSFGEQATFCGFIIRARLISTKIFPEFLIYFLRSDRVRSRLISGSGHVAITNISQNTLQDLYIVIPSYTEQKEIAEMLFSIDEQIEKESNHKEQLQYLKNGLMKVLLTGKLRVAV